jgi:hypothetical protein
MGPRGPSHVAVFTWFESGHRAEQSQSSRGRNATGNAAEASTPCMTWGHESVPGSPPSGRATSRMSGRPSGPE